MKKQSAFSTVPRGKSEPESLLLRFGSVNRLRKATVTDRQRKAWPKVGRGSACFAEALVVRSVAKFAVISERSEAESVPLNNPVRVSEIHRLRSG
jgi:hypothetical protein